MCCNVAATLWCYLIFVEQDALMSPNPKGKLEDLATGCVCII